MKLLCHLQGRVKQLRSENDVSKAVHSCSNIPCYYAFIAGKKILRFFVNTYRFEKVKK